MKKKVLIITGIVVAILVVAGLVTSYMDSARVRNGVEPKFVVKITTDGGNKVTYWGLGYKVVRYPCVSPNEPYKNNRGVKYGSWFMRYELENEKNNNTKTTLNDINNFITDYFAKDDVDKSNIAYWAVEENAVVVGMMDISTDKQEEFIYNVFSSCCGSEYIKYINENKLIEFKEAIDIFDAQIIEAKDNSITVKVLKNSKSFKKDDKVTMKITRQTSGVNDFYVIGNKVRITFNGMVETSNPAQIGASKIELITK